MVLRNANSPTFMKLWGVPFMLIGLYLFAGRFVVDAWARRGITYAVTDKRVLILRAPPFAKFTAMTFDQLPPLNLHERGDGRGTIGSVRISLDGPIVVIQDGRRRSKLLLSSSPLKMPEAYSTTSRPSSRPANEAHCSVAERRRER